MAKHKLHGLLNKELIMILLNNKLRIILFMLCIFIFVMPTNLALPFLYDSDKEPLQVGALDPRIPSWYSVKDWEVKYCLNYANEKDAIEVRTSPDNKNTDFGNVISAQAYKSTVPNPDDPTKTTFLYEVSYFVMPGKEVTYKVQLLKSLTDTKPENLITPKEIAGYVGEGGFVSIYSDEVYEFLAIEYTGVIEFKGKVVEKNVV
ncbi:hypothetical protein J4434_03260 [Candidatus Woesearchaeota archaeon]|nr:hypothetical protein [Candidatus Woesearchaeota archaeon]